MGIRGLSHVILLVADLDRSVPFYEGLGLMLTGRAGEFAFFDGSGVTLALREHESPSRPGSTEVVFEVDDIAADFARLRDRGVEFRLEPRPVMAAGDRELHAADFTDPDGHVLSITGWVPAASGPAEGE